MRLSLCFSPCPNDTAIFDAMVHAKIDTSGFKFEVRLEDVETLNRLAMEGVPDICKVSFHAFLYLRERYELLTSGSALGFGNGPLVISKKKYSMEDLENLTVAIPGEYTTAHLLLKIASPGVKKKKVMVFSEIEDAILRGEVDAGVIIHENRFTYEKKGLYKITDLGDLWEKLTGLPVPLGCIVIKKSLGPKIIKKINRVMHESVGFAMEYPDDVMEYVKQHAQEMDEEVMKKHIRLYVNSFTLDLGIIGRKAINALFEIAGRL
ncbi:MAG: 1,4-dihydroxy-6-naphthoate synthase [Bacteroidetes bacterium]|nr:1,4-dihydroxy-6-naphthoate synthase [Bacteroidota bacterium]